MSKHLKFMAEHLDDSDKTKFSLLEYERLRRVVDYMRTTEYDEEKLTQGRKNFATWFHEYDKRSGTKLTEFFPELETFYYECKLLTLLDCGSKLLYIPIVFKELTGFNFILFNI